MTGIPYFPGCSLKDTGKALEASAVYVMDKLGAPLVELDAWNCCGTVFSLSDDDLMHHVASVRNLRQAQIIGASELVALCAMCFNTLHRVSDRIRVDREARDKINAFMEREEKPAYEGGVTVRHLLEVLRDTVTWDRVSEAVERPLDGLRVAPYYGCTLLRPRAVAVDDPERPTVLARAMEAVGAEPVSFAFQGECCGSYQVVDRRDLSIERSDRILRSARRAGADVVATACPLCQFNLEQAQAESAFADCDPLPIVYFTELLALALGRSVDEASSESIRRAERLTAERLTAIEEGTQQ